MPAVMVERALIFKLSTPQNVLIIFCRYSDHKANGTGEAYVEKKLENTVKTLFFYLEVKLSPKWNRGITARNGILARKLTVSPP